MGRLVDIDDVVRLIKTIQLPTHGDPNDMSYHQLDREDAAIICNSLDDIPTQRNDREQAIEFKAIDCRDALPEINVCVVCYDNRGKYIGVFSRQCASSPKFDHIDDNGNFVYIADKDDWKWHYDGKPSNVLMDKSNVYYWWPIAEALSKARIGTNRYSI